MFTLHSKYSVIDLEGFDTPLWGSATEHFASIEEALYVITSKLWWGADPLTDTTYSFELLKDGEVILRTGDLSPHKFLEARMCAEEGEAEYWKENTMAGDAAEESVIDDDDLPF
jgi:hypothetical protein